MKCDDDVDANLDLEDVDMDVEGIEMDKGAMDESESSDPDEDGEESDRTFYYDPSLDGPHNALPGHQVAGSILHNSTIGVPDSLHFSPGPTSANPPDCNPPLEEMATGQESRISEHPTHVSAPMAPPIHRPALFTGPLIPLPSESQFLQMSNEDRWTYICRLQLQRQALMATAAAQAAEIEAANAYCALAKYEISILREQQAREKGKGQTMKTASRWVTHPDLKNASGAQPKEREEKAARETENTANKRAEHEARTSRTDHVTVLKTFESPLSAYKRKDDLVTIARTLQIAVEPKDTIATLLKNIKAQMVENPALAQNPRFSALFGEARRGQRGKRIASDHSTQP